MFSTIVVNAKIFYPNLNYDTAILVLKKLVDKLVAFRKERSLPTTNKEYEHITTLSNKETYGLLYIGGYVMHKLFEKMKNSKSFEEPNVQMAISFLNAGKLNEDNNDDYKLFDEITRGGLWKISSPVKIILKLLRTSSKNLHPNLCWELLILII